MAEVKRQSLYRIDSDGTSAGTRLIRLEDNTEVPGVRSITWEIDAETKEARCVVELLSVELKAAGLKTVDGGEVRYLRGEQIP